MKKFYEEKKIQAANKDILSMLASKNEFNQVSKSDTYSSL